MLQKKELATKLGAFVLNGSKSKEFFECKANTSSDTLKRFEECKPKKGIVTPFKNDKL